MYMISKPTRREAEERRREGLANAGLSPSRYRGTARTTEEAHDLQRSLEREGETFDTLTLAPSIHVVAGAGESRVTHWHGWIRGGEIVNA